jgi:hypothetical protein
MDKKLAAVLLDQEAIAFLWAEPLDVAMELAVIEVHLGTRIAKIGWNNLQATVGHLALLFYREDKLLSTF